VDVQFQALNVVRLTPRPTTNLIELRSLAPIGDVQLSVGPPRKGKPVVSPRNIRRTLALSAPARSSIMSNPKTELTDNAKKDPDEWVSGDDPMTGAQASYLKTLCEQAGTPEMFQDNLTKAQASKLIDEMRQKANV
jgi:hypothetical protein